MARTCWLTLRVKPEYRSDAFIRGAEALGYSIVHTRNADDVRPNAGDMVVVWNMHGVSAPCAKKAWAAGADLVVAENGYVKVDRYGREYYALSLDGHNGSGRWRVRPGDGSRFDALGVDIEPWIDAGDPKRPYILIADQRGLGSDLMKSPNQFGHSAWTTLKRTTRRDPKYLRVRGHPGRHQPQRTLDEDLSVADTVVVWSSQVGTTALLRGIPTYYCAPYWIMADAAVYGVPRHDHEYPYPDRRPVLERMAYGQWRPDEIETGEALDWLLNGHGELVGPEGTRDRQYGDDPAYDAWRRAR